MKAELASLDVIRVETVLSRFPIHRLAKLGTVPIEIRETTAAGELTLRWEVSHNSRYGQPGPLGYKIDTLVVSRKLDEAGRPTPRILRLGSLTDICRELGLVDSGANKADIKRALYQNAGAFITAKIRYKAIDGTRKSLEFGTTRYTVVMTGETLPDGRRADAVYILLHDLYREVLDSAPVRPLDYDYIQALPPASQRLYELLSYHVFAALKHGQPRARMRYSEFCCHAPQTRYTGFGPMRKQMAKVHAPHLGSSYLTEVTFEATTDREGSPDWMMVYSPGPKARAEFQAFTRKGGPVPRDIELALFEPKPEPEPEPEPTGLEQELMDRGVTRGVAAELVRDVPAERIRRQVEVADWLRETKPQRVKDLGAYLAEAIRKDFAAPAGFKGQAERAAAEATARAQQDQREQARRATAREREERDRVRAYWEALPPERRAALDAEALAGADPADRAAYAAATAPQVRRLLRAGLRDAHLRRLLGLPAAD